MKEQKASWLGFVTTRIYADGMLIIEVPSAYVPHSLTQIKRYTSENNILYAGPLLSMIDPCAQSGVALIILALPYNEYAEIVEWGQSALHVGVVQKLLHFRPGDIDELTGLPTELEAERMRNEKCSFPGTKLPEQQGRQYKTKEEEDYFENFQGK